VRAFLERGRGAISAVRGVAAAEFFMVLLPSLVELAVIGYPSVDRKDANCV
jgi:hypothetical protein